MFDYQFYPTPPNLIDKMIAPFVRVSEYNDRVFRTIHGSPYGKPRRILEPSAGKGDILDHLIAHYHVEKRRTICIEIDPDLRHILRGKSYQIVDTDFLEYEGDYLSDLIVMNPPFQNGAEHLLHAWQILQAGDIACLLNAQTIKNPHTQARQTVLDLVELYGRYEFVDGNPFLHAERRANVEVAIVWLHKDKKPLEAEFGGLQLDWDAPEKEGSFHKKSPLAHRGIIHAVVSQYEAAKRCLVKMNALEKEYSFYTNGISSPLDQGEKDTIQHDYNLSLSEKVDELKARFWKYIFQQTKLSERLTSDYVKKFHAYREDVQRLGFTVKNVTAVLEHFLMNYEQMMEDCLVAIFDEATNWHKKNKINVEGWKTNKAYRLNYKIIVPYGISFDGWWTMAYSRREFFDDLDKALCWLTGKDIKEITTIGNALDSRRAYLNQEERHTQAYRDLIESTFFQIRIYKKGTVHLVFKDKDLLALFNRIAAKGKNWIGDGE